jgi:PKD repeat protein
MLRNRSWSGKAATVSLLAAAILLPLVVASPVAQSSTARSRTTLYVPRASIVPRLGAAFPYKIDKRFGNVDYNGGPVMPSNTAYLVFWSPSGYGAYGSTEYETGLEKYFTDLQHESGKTTNTNSVAAQYNDTTGAFSRYSFTSGGGLLDTDPYPASQCPVEGGNTECMTDAQLQTEAKAFTAAHGLKQDLSHEYFFLFPPGVQTCFTDNPNDNPPYGGCSAGEVGAPGEFCAYHANTTSAPLVIYADDPYVTNMSGCDDGNHPNGPSDGAIEGGLSHELNESVSDPLPNDAWTNGYGIHQGFEIGDQCEGQYGPVLGTHNGANYNQVINGDFYWYQEEWSNYDHTCLQHLSLPGKLPHATFTVKAGSGRTLKFNARGSTAPGGVADYVWQFNDANGAQTVERTTPTISHTFPKAGAYAVGLTVFSASGLSAGAGAIVTTGHAGTTSGFSVSPAKLSHGRTVHFSAIRTVSAKPVLVYFWEFGDGTTGSGATPSHVYAAAGTYTVTLVMFSGVGSAFPGVGAGPVTTKKIKVS